jgi:hypothetical protein
LQAQVQQKQAAVELAQQEGQQKLALMAAKHQSDAEIATARAQMESDLAVRQQNLQAWLDAQELVLNAHKHAAEQDSKVQIAKFRQGGAINK